MSCDKTTKPDHLSHNIKYMHKKHHRHRFINNHTIVTCLFPRLHSGKAVSIVNPLTTEDNEADGKNLCIARCAEVLSGVLRKTFCLKVWLFG